MALRCVRAAKLRTPVQASPLGPLAAHSAQPYTSGSVFNSQYAIALPSRLAAFAQFLDSDRIYQTRPARDVILDESRKAGRVQRGRSLHPDGRQPLGNVRLAHRPPDL